MFIYRQVAASSDTWKQRDRNKGIPLPEIDVDTFQLYIHWVYSDTIDLSGIDTSCGCSQSAESIHDDDCKGRNDIYLLARLYVAGDFLLDVRVRNSAIDKMLECLRDRVDIISSSTLAYIWENTAAGCPLRSCLFDVLTSELRDTGLRGEYSNYSPEFLFEFCNHQLRHGGRYPMDRQALYNMSRRYHCRDTQ